MDFKTVMETPKRENSLLVNRSFVPVGWNQLYNIYNDFFQVVFIIFFSFLEEFLQTGGVNFSI